MSIEKVLYTAQASATGGREGSASSPDGVLAVQLSIRANWAALAALAPSLNNCSPPAIRHASLARSNSSPAARR